MTPDAEIQSMLEAIRLVLHPVKKAKDKQHEEQRERHMARAAANQLRKQAAECLRMADLLEATPDALVATQHDGKIDECIMVACAAYAVGINHLVGSRRDKTTVLARQVAQYLIRMTVPKISYPQLGALFNRDHSTVIHAVRVIEKKIKREPMFAELIAKLVLACTHHEIGEGN